MKYIDAGLLRYEIKRRNLSEIHVDTEGYEEELLEIIDSLQQEQQEVDLEDEMDRFFEEMPIHEHENIFEDTYHMIARHFYEFRKNSE